jgi:hypothetical protein
MITDHIADGLLRTARNPHHTLVHFHAQILCRRHRTGNLPRPFAIFLIDPSLFIGTRFLRYRQRQEQQQERDNFGKPFQLSPSDLFCTNQLPTPSISIDLSYVNLP